MAFVWPKMIEEDRRGTSHPVIHARNLPRINGDLFSLVSKPAKLFSKINNRVFHHVKKMPLACFFET